MSISIKLQDNQLNQTMISNILVTGATGHLGSAFCKAAVESDYYVIGTNQPGKSPGGLKNVELFEVDLTSEDRTHDFVRLIREKHEKLRAAVLLVGGFAMSNISNTTTDDLMDMYELNFLTTFNMVKPVYEWMKETGGGKIIMVSAKPVYEGGASEVLPYVLAKSNVSKLAEVLNETGKQDNISSSIIVPSIIDTPVNREAMPDANFKEWVAPDEIAANILHLVSGNGGPLRDTVLKVYGNS